MKIGLIHLKERHSEHNICIFIFDLRSSTYSKRFHRNKGNGGTCVANRIKLSRLLNLLSIFYGNFNYFFKSNMSLLIKTKSADKPIFT